MDYMKFEETFNILMIRNHAKVDRTGLIHQKHFYFHSQ